MARGEMEQAGSGRGCMARQVGSGRGEMEQANAEVLVREQVTRSGYGKMETREQAGGKMEKRELLV